VLLAVLLLLAAATGVGVAFKDQIFPENAGSAAAQPAEVASGDSPETDITTDIIENLEAAILDAVLDFAEELPNGVNCLTDGEVAIGDQVDCIIEGPSWSVDVTVTVTGLDPVTYEGDLNPTSFPAADPTPAEDHTDSPQPDPTLTHERADARSELNRLRNEDVQLLPLDGQWAVQLASKAEGITDPLQVAANGTHTFHATDILAEHESFRSDPRFAGNVRLVKGSDFGEISSYNGKPFWITLLIGDFSSSDDVESWCAAKFPELDPEQLANSCLPRTLDPPHQ